MVRYQKGIMKGFEKKYGPWALITGASSGIGAEFARQLGTQGLNLLIVARRLDRMEQLAEELKNDCGVEVRPVKCDLGSADFMSVLRPHLEELDIGLLVNNAGFTNTGAVIDNDLECELELLYVNCRASLILAHELGNRLKSSGHGGMIFVSSTTAFAPPTLWANYAASKAYVLALGEAMHEEMRPVGVDVLVVCPGPARTDFYAISHLDLSKGAP
jgi:uncharacterized protein